MCNYMNINMNPVRDYRSVENRCHGNPVRNYRSVKADITKHRMPSGMRPVCCNMDAFHTECGGCMVYNFLPSDTFLRNVQRNTTLF